MKRVRIADARGVSGPTQPKVIRSLRVPDGIDARTVDGLQNVITGMGTARDKSTATTFSFTEMSKQQLESAYRSDWIARKVTDIPAKDATREWRTWQSDKKDTTILEDAEKGLQLQRKCFQAMVRARLYGGGGLLLGVDQGSLEKPLIPEKVGKDGLKFVHVVSKWELSAGDMDWDIESEFYGQPKYYTRSGTTGSYASTDKIHPSRIVRFLGSELPDPTIASMPGWGDSVLQVVQDAILSAGTAVANGSQLLQEVKMDVIKIPELSNSLSNKKYESRLSARFASATLMKSLYNVLLLDSEEEWERITANLTGIPDTLRMYLLIASGAADIPATRMLGQSPAGLSATGESDLRNYYDHVKSEQVVTLDPSMKRLNEVFIRSALGTTQPGDVTHEWRPLWQIEEQTKSTVIGQKAASYKIDVDAAQIPAEVLRDARINQLIEDGVYPGLDQILEDYGPLEDIEPPPEPGAVIGPDGKPISPLDPAHPVNQAQAAKIDPKTGKPIIPPAANQNAPVKKAVGDMAKRIRDAQIVRARVKAKTKDGLTTDVQPMTLYVSRPVLNAKEIIGWAKSQGIGIEDLEPASELHVTIMYSRKQVDWTKAGVAYGEDEDGRITIKPGGMRMVDKFGAAIVLLFNSNDLAWRHCDLKNIGSEWDYEDYHPHVTIAYPSGVTDLSKIEPYRGKIELGAERFEEIREGGYTKDSEGNAYEVRPVRE